MTLRVGSLCSGYGGLELGLQSLIDAEVVWHVENDKHPSAVLEARFPGVPNHGDVKTTDWTAVEPVDIFTAGYPCQPESLAGKGLSENDPRWLWPDIAHAVGILRPRYLFLENVAGHFVRGFRTVLGSLTSLGYDTQWTLVRASDAGAPHRRERLFILASEASGARLGEHARGSSAQETRAHGHNEPVGAGPREIVADPDSRRLESRTEFHRDAPSDSSDRDSRWRHADRRRDIAANTDESGREGTEPARGCVLSARRSASDADQERRQRDWRPRHRSTGPADNDLESALDWGTYELAIRRWERALRRPAPRPTELGPRGNERLNQRFVEWMQGLPDGWVTDILPRNPALKCLGNGVVPQQAALALRLLLPLTVTEEAA